MHDPPTPEKILQTGMAFWASKTLLSAVEIGVFTELAHGPASLGPLSQRIGLHSRSARDFLDALWHSASSNERMAATAILPRPICFSTGINYPTSAASLKWRIIASTLSGASSPKHSVPVNPRTNARPAARASSRRFMPTLAAWRNFSPQ